jgi:type I site-specific restriction endonuclease
VLAIIGWLVKRQWDRVEKMDSKIEDLPEKYVPRKELHERWLRMETAIAHTDKGIDDIKHAQRDLQKDFKGSVQRLHDKLDALAASQNG